MLMSSSKDDGQSPGASPLILKPNVVLYAGGTTNHQGGALRLKYIPETLFVTDYNAINQKPFYGTMKSLREYLSPGRRTM